MTRHAPESVVVGEYKGLQHQMRITVLVLNTSRIKLGFDLTSGVGRERLEHWIHRHGYVLIKFQIRQSLLNRMALPLLLYDFTATVANTPANLRPSHRLRVAS